MTRPSLLPPSAGQLERDLESVMDRELFAGVNNDPEDTTIPIRHIFNVDKVSDILLPYIAFMFSVDYWEDAWSEEQKREIIKAAFGVHSIKGTLKSIEDVCAALGFTVTQIEEGVDGHWANYKVHIGEPISNEVAETLKRLITSTAPLRCNLVEIVFSEAQHDYDGTIPYDGTYNYGRVV